jgi:hypothetical protein
MILFETLAFKMKIADAIFIVKKVRILSTPFLLFTSLLQDRHNCLPTYTL